MSDLDREQVRQWVGSKYGDRLSQKQMAMVAEYIMNNDPEIFGEDVRGAMAARHTAIRYDIEHGRGPGK